MIERKFVAEKLKEHQVQEFVGNNLKRAGYSHTKVQRTPLGEKIIIHTSRPGLAVGRKGQSIKLLTKDLKKEFSLENPQIEISEVTDYNLDAQIVADTIAASLERFGTNKFKGIGHKAMSDCMNAGALGVEIIISGKVPSARAKRWRFYQGYLKKSGDIANMVLKAYAAAQLKTGTVGIQVSIMPPDIKLPDDMSMKDSRDEAVVEEVVVEDKKKKPGKETKKRAAPRKKAEPKKKSEPKNKDEQKEKEEKTEKKEPAEENK